MLRMMMMRTTDGQPWLAGQSKANQSKQHRGKAAQWGRHKDRVHTRLAGHREGGREFKNKRFTVVALAQETSRRQRQDAVLEGGTSMRRRTEKAISMNTRNRRISRLTFSGGSA